MRKADQPTRRRAVLFPIAGGGRTVAIEASPGLEEIAIGAADAAAWRSPGPDAREALAGVLGDTMAAGASRNVLRRRHCLLGT